MVAGVIQYGSLLFTYNGMLDTARTTSRQVAVGSDTPSAASSKARGKKLGWVAAGKMAVATDDSDPDEVTTEISMDSEDATVLPLLPMPDEISVSVTMAKES